MGGAAEDKPGSDGAAEGTPGSDGAQAALLRTLMIVTLVSGLVDAVNDDEVVTDPATDLALFDQYVKGLKADEVTAAAGARA